MDEGPREAILTRLDRFVAKDWVQQSLASACGLKRVTLSER
jgi:hypothetical protein